MSFERRLLVGFILGFLFIASLFVWGNTYRYIKTFKAGSPPLTQEITPDPTLPSLRASDPAIGNTRAPVTIVEFANYHCAYCKLMAPDLRALADQGVVRLIWREAAPKDQTDEALLPLLAARCADRRQKFSAMHAGLFALGDYTESSILDLGASIGLEPSELRSCLQDRALKDRLKQDIANAQANHITAAPTLFINGKPYVGLVEREELFAVVSQAAQK